ncbi:hypothetical protein CsSME_00024164 [Camellia sinensis var. sinensis]
MEVIARIVVALGISKDLSPIAKVSRAVNVQLAKLDNQGNNTWQHSVNLLQAIKLYSIVNNEDFIMWGKNF